jgi:hypothetical protein
MAVARIRQRRVLLLNHFNAQGGHVYVRFPIGAELIETEGYEIRVASSHETVWTAYWENQDGTREWTAGEGSVYFNNTHVDWSHYQQQKSLTHG